MTLAEMITAARGKVTEAESSGDQAKIAAAKAELQALQGVQGAGYVHTQSDIDNAITNRLPDAQSSAKAAERKALAQRLGVSVEDLDDELKRIEDERRGKQSEVQRISGDLTKREQELATEKAEREKAQRIAETARKNLENSLKRSAVEGALLKRGVVRTEERDYLGGAMRLTDLASVEVEVEVDDEGNLKVKGDVKGAEAAAEKTKKDYPAMFSDHAPSAGRVPQNPKVRSENQKTGYTPNYSVPGKKE